MMTDTATRSSEGTDAVKIVELISRRWLSKKAFEIELTRPLSFHFAAGQTIRFLHDHFERYYSIVSSPNEQTLILCIRYIEKGVFTPILAAAESGTRFQLTGPHGYFTFKPSPRPPIFVATGTGIAPFVSMGRSGVTDFMLLHGSSSPADLYYRSYFADIAAHYIPCISKPIPSEKQTPNMFQGKVTRYVCKVLKRAEYDFYLCGREEMTRDVTLLVDKYFPGSLVYTEVFF